MNRPSAHAIDDVEILPPGKDSKYAPNRDSTYGPNSDFRPLTASEELNAAGELLVSELNTRLFAQVPKDSQGNAIGPVPEFKLTLTSSGKRKWLVRQNVWSNHRGSYLDEILIGCECHAHGDLKDLALSVARTMMLLLQLRKGKTHRNGEKNSLSPYRNRQHANWMAQAGLHTHKPGQIDKRPAVGSGLHVLIVPGGLFDRVMDDILDQGFVFPWEAVQALPAADDVQDAEGGDQGTPKDKSKQKFVCASCGQIARANHTAKLVCGGTECGLPPMVAAY